jgi:hypothetical protein
LDKGYVGKPLNSVRFHPDGLLFALPTDSSIYIHTVEHKKPIFVLEDENFTEIKNIDFSENGYHMLAYNEHSIRIWDLRKSAVLETITPSSRINNASFDFSGSLVTISLENNIGVNFVKKDKTIYLNKNNEENINLKDDSSYLNLDQEIVNSIENEGCLNFKVLSNTKSVFSTKKGIIYYN